MSKSLLNRYVRYIYRKMMVSYGKQRVREQGLRVYVLTTKERENITSSSVFSQEFKDGIYELCREWGIPVAKISEHIEVVGTSEQLDSILKDLTPIRVRIRKLTPRECMRLQGVPDDDFEKMKGAGLSNSSLYKLAGNSICTAPLKGIFTQLMREDSECLF